MHDVVVGIDRSETARRAAERAVELANAFGVNLHLVMCVDRSRSAEVKVGGQRFTTDWLTQAEQFLENLSGELGAAEITTMVGLGDPADTLRDEAERLDARAIVVGNRRVQGASRVLGSVALDVLRHAPCDVLVAHTRD